MRKLTHKEIREVVQSSVNGFTLITLNLCDAFLFKELKSSKPQGSFSVLVTTEAVSNIRLQNDLGKLRHWAVSCQELDIIAI